MKIVFSFLITLFILTGCTSSLIANQYLIQSPMTIETSEFNSYLIGHTNKGSFNIYRLTPPKYDDVAQIQYLMDDNGDIFDPARVEVEKHEQQNATESLMY